MSECNSCKEPIDDEMAVCTHCGANNPYNEKSWELMGQRYEPLTDHEIDWHEANSCRAMAHFPIECAHVDHGSEPPMSDIWWGYCNLLAWYSRRQKGDIEGANFVVDLMAAERQLPLVEEGPARFLEHVVTKFEAVVQRLEQDESAPEHYAQWLREDILHIQRIRGGIQAWTEARELDIQARNACA